MYLYIFILLIFFSPLYFILAILYVCLILIVISNNRILVYWVLMECSVAFFLPFIISNNYGLERRFKYFLVQISNSFFFLISLLLSFKGFEIFLLIFLIYKVGRAPFYQWVVYIVRRISWVNIYILISIIKIIPIILVINFLVKNKEIYFFIVLSCVIGGLGGLGQISLRILMVYSSINHLSWILSCILLGNIWCINYIFIYFIILYRAFFFFFIFNLDFISQINNLDKWNIFVICNLLNLRGLPPFTVFILKFFVLKGLIFNKIELLVLFLLLNTLFALFYYIRLRIYRFFNRYVNFCYENKIIQSSYFILGLLRGLRGVYFVI